MKRTLFFALALLALIAGCEKKQEAPAVADTIKPAATIARPLPTPKRLFEEPAIAYKFELPTEALQIWRDTRTIQPALVVFSSHPFLERVDEERQTDVAELIRAGDADTFRRRGSYFRVDPALVPTQTLSAAIDNGFFSEIIWVIPTRAGIEELSLDVFRKQVVEAGFLTEEEGGALFFADGVYKGMVRGLPFRAVHPDVLPDLTVPVVVHFDTAYFKGIFKNEVATPLYDLLHQTILRIKQSEWNVYSATLSYSTEDSMFSLDVRFLITALARMIEDPTLLQNMPKGWKLHAEAMYLGNMYMESKAQEMIEEAFVAAPDDPAIVYALSQVRFQQGRIDEAFTLIDSTVELDPGYAVAYVQFAETGREKGDLVKALDLQRKAVRHYPENPFLQINEANILILMKRPEAAIQIINGLQLLPWSPYFHGNAAANLNLLAEYARNPSAEQPAQAEQEKK